MLIGALCNDEMSAVTEEVSGNVTPLKFIMVGLEVQVKITICRLQMTYTLLPVKCQMSYLMTRFKDSVGQMIEACDVSLIELPFQFSSNEDVSPHQSKDISLPFV